MDRFLRRTTTLKDIARAAGYSVNTISRALRDKDDIAPDTVKAIKKIAAKMGYINNAAAVSLRLGHTNVIAVILGDISNPHFSIMMKEIEKRSRSAGYDSFLMNTNEDPEMERGAIQAALNKNVDGIIICPSQHDDSNIRYLIETGIPFVQISRHFDLPGAGYVICNDELGGYQATKYLLDKGHRDIVMLTGPSYISSARERRDGYHRALREQGVKYRSYMVRESSLTGCSGVIEKMLKEKLEFTAIFAFSDMLAWDAWTSLRKFGLRVPEDCSIVGFDNIQSRFSIPFRLTTISSYKAKMSTFAVESLLSVIVKTISPETTTLVIDTELVEGETVKRLGAGGDQ
ncbi:MAG: LacI family transcriptional regulator [Spirochaetaceae bacterium]|jgi:LacI family transcriptional regulator|nr:LacI family transcriptional regulator [Spirochaetaceae bacterium]